jgi:hypothetical protein
MYCHRFYESNNHAMNQKLIFYTVLPCEVSPCQNGGVCSNEEDGSFKCTCTTGYTGLMCTRKGNCMYVKLKNNNYLKHTKT